MTLLFVMNLNFSWGAVAAPTFNPYWAANSNTFINAIYPAVVPK